MVEIHARLLQDIIESVVRELQERSEIGSAGHRFEVYVVTASQTQSREFCMSLEPSM